MVADAANPNRENENKVAGMNNHVYGFSYLRAIACVAVIVLHTVYSAVLLYGNGQNQSIMIISMAIVDCLMWAVPCFIMVTGALLLNPDKQIGYKKLFGQYIARIFIALVLFGMVFRIFDVFMDKEPVNLKGFLYGFYEIFTGTGWSHIWYLYLLIGLYLLLPFYIKAVDQSSKNEISYLLGLYILFLSILPVLQIWNINCGFYIHVSTIYPFYLFCGYAIYRHVWKPGKILSGILVLVGTFLIVILTVIRWQHNNPALEVLWGYSSFLVVIQAIGIFSLLKDAGASGKCLIKKILLKIDSCSFGIYLIHMIFVRLLLRYMGVNPYQTGGVVTFIVLICGNLFISYIIIWGLKKIPYIGNIL